MRRLLFAIWCVFSFVLSYLIFFLLITFIQINIIPREMLENFLELLSMTGDVAFTRWLYFSGSGLSLLLAIMTCHEVWAMQHHAEA
ncbi:hypothetical protein IBT47_06720 [Erwinia sp. S43]|uniref:Uncharacterized protein n=1 Tax=Pantoea coffeiphila TaxID=1465635 RepID=A0A2S9IHY8_9GAMM|nr:MULTISPECIES: hypothetical protein [Erwiniaceae]MBK0003802.1 hypothetical protein [Erwinia sp. S38]MBK0031968.1 hypothetical protein [Erwinia sp. S43]MBM7342626.1 hypothetical protein [Pantoea coffeiphila]MCW1876785.1 hypothetical protein [Erwinia sp. INIA01]PRD17406.1 hypothetical protein CQW29_01880 [Pantoea coffeiphila]